MQPCKSIGCIYPKDHKQDFCKVCLRAQKLKHLHFKAMDILEADAIANKTLAQKYPKYFKSVGKLTEIDVYAVHQLFDIQDPAGAIQHASKKLLLSGVRTGGKSAFKDITEARDTLNRWLELNEEVVG